MMKFTHQILLALVFLGVVGHSQNSAFALEEVCTEQLAPRFRTDLKWDPGHYIAIANDTETSDVLKATLDETKLPEFDAKVKGVLKRYFWSDMQDLSEGDTHFARLLGDIGEARARGKKLVIMMMWKYSNSEGQNVLPTYLRDIAPARLGAAYENVRVAPFYRLNESGASARGTIANMGHPEVADAMIRFLKRLAANVDTREAVAAIVFQETSMSVTPNEAPYEPTSAAGVDPMTVAQFVQIQSAYIDGVVRVVSQAACIFKKTPVIQLTNFPPVKLPSMTAAFRKFGVGMGGPDVWYNDPTLDGEDRAYSYYDDVEQQVPIATFIAGGNLVYESHEGEKRKDRDGNGVIDALDWDVKPRDGKNDFTLETIYGWDEYDTVDNLARKAVQQLFANFVFWKKNGPDGDKYYDALKDEMPTWRIPRPNADCPTDYYAKCVRD